MFLRTSNQLLPISLMVVLYGFTSSNVHAQDDGNSVEDTTTEESVPTDVESGSVDDESAPLTETVEDVVDDIADDVAVDPEPSTEVEEPPKDFETLIQRTGLARNGSTSGVETATVQDIAAFKQSYKRYRDRLEEFNSETLEMVEIRHAEGRQNIVDKYDESLTKLEADLAIQKETMVSRFERFFLTRWLANKGGV